MVDSKKRVVAPHEATGAFMSARSVTEMKPLIPLTNDESAELLSRRLFFGPQEVADLLGTSRGFIYNLIDAGSLRSIKLEGRRMIAASELQRLAEMASADS
jgi:excisionase family DNA binding protein